MAIALPDVREYVNDLPRVYPPANAAPEQLGLGDGSATIFFTQYGNIQTNSLVVYMGTLQTQGTTQAMVWTAVPPAAFTQSVSNNQQLTFNAGSTTSTGAVNATGQQTVGVTSTAGMYVGMALTFGNEVVQVSGIGANTITATFANTHLTGAALSWTGAPAAGVPVGARYMATAVSDSLLTKIMTNNVARYVDDQTSLKGCLNDWIDVLLTNQDLIRLVRYADYMTDARMVVQQFDKVKSQLQNELEGGPRPGAQIPYMTQVHAPDRTKWSLKR